MLAYWGATRKNRKRPRNQPDRATKSPRRGPQQLDPLQRGGEIGEADRGSRRTYRGGGGDQVAAGRHCQASQEAHWKRPGTCLFDEAQMNCKPGRHENQWTVGHRMTGTPEYKSWQAMRARCNNSRDKDFDKYGGRGITVCVKWSDSFERFFADMGARPGGTTLERRDNNGPYCKKNCYWATRTEQTRNRRNALNVTMRGQTKPLKVWCDELGINYFTAHRRLKRNGWPLDRVFSRDQR
jgi:hypothetical protein